MTPLVCSWLLSSIGAGLFFAAGVAYTARRVARSGAYAESRCSAIERELAQRTAERQQLFRELEIERGARLARREQAVKDTHDMTSLTAAGVLEELAIAREQLSRRDSQIEGLRQGTAQLRSLEGELTQTKREMARLHAEYDDALATQGAYLDDPGLALVRLAVEPMSSANDNRQN